MKNVLVVDDSALVRKIARKILTNMAFAVSEAEDGPQALRQCAAAMPDVILLDWNMPVMDGLQFLGHLREMPNGSEPKVVFCTAKNDKPSILKAMDAGADEYVMKPFDEHIIRGKFEQLGLA